MSNLPSGAACLLIGADRVPLEIRRSPRRRTLAVEVHRDLRVLVRAPTYCPSTMLDAWVAQRTPWIARQLARFRELGAAAPAPPRFVTGESHLFVGEPHRLEVIEARPIAVSRINGTLRITVPPGAGPERVRRALEDWYRAQAQVLFAAVLAQRMDYFQDRGHASPAIVVRRMKTRWGSLAGRRVMTLNLALVRAPRECIEYVVVHELCHLRYRGHGPHFHRLMDRLVPDWRERKRRLEALPLA